jgi:stearoyl-CoA desaturase (delta-9 desaturase)
MKRTDKLFGHRLLMTPIASYIGYGSMLYGAWALLTGSASLWWILPMLFFTFMLLMGVTVGLHRLFCHQSFQTSKIWHVILVYLGTLGVYGSSVQWCAMHVSHHKYSDTEKDPHYTGVRYLFWKMNNYTEFHKKTLVRLYKDPMHRFFHNYYFLVILATVFLLLLINPLALVFCYLIPLGWLHFVGSAHQVFAHNKTGPLDQPIMEFLLFTGGEWLHKHHHMNGRDPKFGTLDAGYHFINLIKS